MPIYPKSFVQRLREEIPVSHIIGKRLTLKKKGKEFEACCPFHQEKTPSFFVNDQKGFYHCFGCSAHGDSITFLMEHDRLSYPQAIELLAREAGVPLPEVSPEMEQEEKRRQSLQEVVEMACQWFQEQLQLSHGQAARDYLRSRGLTEATLRQFRLGYSPEDRYALKHFLKNEGVEEAQMLEAGLIIKPEDGRPAYDRFRDRVIFPIADRHGEIIAFGGRLMVKSETAPKYLNSPETPLFHKGQLLYNWHHAKIALRDDLPIIVAEGYMDVIALHQHGFPGAVAPLGTALTETHLKGLWRYQDAPVLCLDGDAAGQRAMWRSAELALPLLQPGKTLRFLMLPEGQDPDDFLRDRGTEAFRQQLEHTVPLSQMLYETVTTRHGAATPEQRAAAEAELTQLCNRIRHESVQHHFRQYFREQRYAQSGAVGNHKPWRGTPAQMPAPPSAPSRSEAILQCQRQLLKLLILNPSLLQQGEITATLERMPITEESLAAIQHQLLEQGVAESPETEALRENSQVRIPKQAQAHPQLVWQQLVDGLTLAQLEEEILGLKHEVTEASLQQIQALQAEKEAILQRQYL